MNQSIIAEIRDQVERDRVTLTALKSGLVAQ